MLEPRVPRPESLERDLSLHNDVLFSLLTVCQLVIDIAGELAGRRGQRFEDYTEAIRSLGADPRFFLRACQQSADIEFGEGRCGRSCKIQPWP